MTIQLFIASRISSLVIFYRFFILFCENIFYFIKIFTHLNETYFENSARNLIEKSVDFFELLFQKWVFLENFTTQN